jgi:hypothetical protein
MALPNVENRLNVVNKVRAHQRAWLDDTRKRVMAGEPFAICNGDEVEELFIVMGIPVLAINYWNFLIAAQGKVEHFTRVLHDRGYAGPHFFAMGLASTLDPGNAPWGGLPKPALIVGSLRYEMELRTTELWAKAFGCPCVPMDFAFPSPPVHDFPANWTELVRDQWDRLVEPNRLNLRIEQEKNLIAYLEQITGRTFDVAALERSMELINEQMDYWSATRLLIGEADLCPVHIRDQMSMYQAMWHRGTPTGVALIKEYYEEVKARVENKVAGYRNEKFRLYYDAQVPPWSSYIEDRYGAVTVACSYSAFPDFYARNVHNNDPLRTLAARHLFLAGAGPARLLRDLRDHHCDAIIAVEPNETEYPSIEKQACEAAGFPYLAVPRDSDDDEVRAKVSEFIETRLM